MIPGTETILNEEQEADEQSSRNYKMYFEDEIINGFNDELEAMKQVIFKILNTERYQYLIYSKDYGVELEDLFGEPVSYVCPEVERRITEALIQDERINSVDSFSFDTSKKRVVAVSFIAHTIFGEVKADKVVNY